MVTKDLVILANSEKLKGHCIAGKDIRTGEWVRLINDNTFPSGDGAPFYYPKLKHLCGYGYGPSLGAIIRVNLAGSRPLYCQPENWVIDGTPWKYLGMYPDDKLRDLIDCNYPIWLANSKYGLPSNIPVNVCNSKKPLASSLIFTELNASQHQPRIYMKTRTKGDSPSLLFFLKGIRYDLTVTDDNFRRKVKSGKIEIGSYDSLLVTLGVGQLYEKMQSHYKLAVGIVQST